MRYLFALSLVTLLVPTLTHSEFESRKPSVLSAQRHACRISEEAQSSLSSGSTHAIEEQLFLQGVTVGSKDQSVSVASLNQAIHAWNECISDHPFRLASPGEEASINVSKLADIQEASRLQGQIEIDASPSGHLKAKVEISDRDRGQLLSDTAIGAVLNHELGHFVGLDDSLESDSSGQEVMGDFDPEHLVLRPSAAEESTVRNLRTELRTYLYRKSLP